MRAYTVLLQRLEQERGAVFKGIEVKPYTDWSSIVRRVWAVFLDEQGSKRVPLSSEHLPEIKEVRGRKVVFDIHPVRGKIASWVLEAPGEEYSGDPRAVVLIDGSCKVNTFLQRPTPVLLSASMRLLLLFYPDDVLKVTPILVRGGTTYQHRSHLLCYDPTKGLWCVHTKRFPKKHTPPKKKAKPKLVRQVA